MSVRLKESAVFIGMGVYFLPVLEESVGCVAIESGDELTVFIADDTFVEAASCEDRAIAGKLDGLIAYTRELHAYIIADFSGFITPAERKFPTSGTHLTDVLGDCTHPCRIACYQKALGGIEHIMAVFLIEVECQV